MTTPDRAKGLWPARCMSTHKAGQPGARRRQPQGGGGGGRQTAAHLQMWKTMDDALHPMLALARLLDAELLRGAGDAGRGCRSRARRPVGAVRQSPAGGICQEVIGRLAVVRRRQRAGCLQAAAAAAAAPRQLAQMREPKEAQAQWQASIAELDVSAGATGRQGPAVRGWAPAMAC